MCASPCQMLIPGRRIGGMLLSAQVLCSEPHYSALAIKRLQLEMASVRRQHCANSHSAKIAGVYRCACIAIMCSLRGSAKPEEAHRVAARSGGMGGGGLGWR